MHRRKLRSTQDLSFWAWFRLNPGMQTETVHLARVTLAEVDAIVRAVLETGRRRGRAELAVEMFERLGFSAELEYTPEMPAMTVEHLSAPARELAAPAYVAREGVTRVEIPATKRTRRSAPKP